MSGEPSLASVLKDAVQDGTARIHTCIPAIVTSYDPTRQTVSARIVIRERYKDRDQSVQSVAGPILTDVPVMFPHSKAGFSATFPLTAGDWVTLHIAERSISEWKATGNTDIVAGDLRRFNLSDAFAYPGGQPPGTPIGSTGVHASAMVMEGADVRLGSSAASDFVALSSKVDAAVNAISTLLKNWIVVPADGGAALKAAAVIALSAASTGATKVKAE